MVTGFNTINGKKYYFNDSGNLRRNGLIRIKKGTYCADKSGVIQRRKVVKIGNKKYYFDKNGKMVTNRSLIIKKVKYNADKNGVLKKDNKKAKSKNKN